MKLIATISLSLLLLTGCYTQSECETKFRDPAIAKLTKENQDLSAAAVLEKIKYEHDEATLEVALACEALPINVCLSTWKNVDIESYQKAGFRGLPTWRYLLAVAVGLVELAAVLLIFTIFPWFIWKTFNQPDSKEVTKAKETIAMAEEEQEKLNRRMAEASEEEARVLASLHKDTATAKAERNKVNKDLSEKKVAYGLYIAKEQAKVDQLKAEISALEQQKNLFGG